MPNVLILVKIAKIMLTAVLLVQTVLIENPTVLVKMGS